MPTIARIGPYRFFFYGNEGSEPPHVHVQRERMLAKFWLDPVSLARPLEERGCYVAQRMRSIPSTPCVPVTGQVHDVDGRGRAARHSINVREARLARGRARARDAPTRQRVNQARFADVRAPDQGNFRQAPGGEVLRARGARDELGNNLQ